ncbi:MAG: hypothetical protein CMD81_09365 [Gammaproteobacteria bacterium]|nr:hypothetical protein [Gammaproteobacteria bacterium]|tara:strand:+ start:232 stop:906 length:675 start_codon:yes stop_codon:yes gene_type:complete
MIQGALNQQPQRVNQPELLQVPADQRLRLLNLRNQSQNQLPQITAQLADLRNSPSMESVNLEGMLESILINTPESELDEWSEIASLPSCSFPDSGQVSGIHTPKSDTSDIDTAVDPILIASTLDEVRRLTLTKIPSQSETSVDASKPEESQELSQSNTSEVKEDPSIENENTSNALATYISATLSRMLSKGSISQENLARACVIGTIAALSLYLTTKGLRQQAV